MDAVTAGLFVAASFASNLITNRNQSKLETVNLKAQLAQAKLQSAEMAYERTKSFRQTLSANLALSGLGVGGVSGARGANAQNISDYFADISALQTQDLFNSISGKAQKASIKGRSFKRTLSAIGDATELANQLGLFAGKKGGK